MPWIKFLFQVLTICWSFVALCSRNKGISVINNSFAIATNRNTHDKTLLLWTVRLTICYTVFAVEAHLSQEEYRRETQGMPKAKQYEPVTKKAPHARQHKTHKIATLTSITRSWVQLLGMLPSAGRVVTKLGFTELDTFLLGTRVNLQLY